MKKVTHLELDDNDITHLRTALKVNAIDPPLTNEQISASTNILKEFMNDKLSKAYKIGYIDACEG